MGDLQKDIDEIIKYSDALDNLQSRGVSESLLGKIAGMGVSDATAYTKKLLDMTDEEYEKYMQLWEQKQTIARSVAEKFYSGEILSLKNEFVDKIPEEFGDLKEKMFGIGQDGAKSLVDGFASVLNNSGLDFGTASVDFASSGLGISSAGIINNMSAGRNPGGEIPGKIELVLKSEEGKTFGRWMVPFIRSEDKSNPEVVSDAV